MKSVLSSKSMSRGLWAGAILAVGSLATLPACSAPQAGAKTVKPAPKDPGRAIFQHGFELTLQGSYRDLHDYLARLEKLPWQMFWNRISVQTEQYPRLRVTIIVQTLSLTKAWLIV